MNVMFNDNTVKRNISAQFQKFRDNNLRDTKQSHDYLVSLLLIFIAVFFYAVYVVMQALELLV